MGNEECTLTGVTVMKANRVGAAISLGVSAQETARTRGAPDSRRITG